MGADKTSRSPEGGGRRTGGTSRRTGGTSRRTDDYPCPSVWAACEQYLRTDTDDRYLTRTEGLPGVRRDLVKRPAHGNRV